MPLPVTLVVDSSGMSRYGLTLIFMGKGIKLPTAPLVEQVFWFNRHENISAGQVSRAVNYRQ